LQTETLRRAHVFFRGVMVVRFCADCVFQAPLTMQRCHAGFEFPSAPSVSPSALHSTFYFWRKSRRLASFLILSTWKIQEV
jgi:hypothetical protein